MGDTSKITSFFVKLDMHFRRLRHMKNRPNSTQNTSFQSLLNVLLKNIPLQTHLFIKSVNISAIFEIWALKLPLFFQSWACIMSHICTKNPQKDAQNTSFQIFLNIFSINTQFCTHSLCKIFIFGSIFKFGFSNLLLFR